jgi:hypothetical protein
MILHPRKPVVTVLLVDGQRFIEENITKSSSPLHFHANIICHELFPSDAHDANPT